MSHPIPESHLSFLKFSTDHENNKDDDKYYFDEVAADLIIEFIESRITHVEGDLTGQPVQLMPMWRRALREFFGWKRKKDGLRRYRRAFWSMPRKHWKSGILATLALYGLSVDHPKARKQIYIIGATEDQGERTFRMAKLLIDQNESLKRNFENGEAVICFRKTKSIFKFLSSSPRGKVGSVPHFILWEENQEQISPKLKSQIETGRVSGSEPAIFAICTAGDDPDPEKPGYKDYLEAKEVLEGRRRLDTLHVMICEAPEDCDPSDPVVWRAANPGWGYSINPDVFEELYNESKDDPVKLKEFMQYNLNIWQQQSSAFIMLDEWDRLYEDYNFEDLAGKNCWGGLDLGQVDDMSAFDLVFPSWSWEEEIDEDGKKQKVAIYDLQGITWYWTPRATVAEAVKSGVPYDKWERDGLLEVTPGNVVDRALIRRRIKTFNSKVKLLGVGYDKWRAQEMAQTMQDRDNITMIDVSQSISSLCEVTVLLKELVKGTRIRHNGNAIYRWNIQCARVITNTHGDEMVSSKVSKGPKGRGKVDGLSARFNALKVFIAAPPPKPPINIYLV